MKPSARMANSSPPSRATVSVGRRDDWRRAAHGAEELVARLVTVAVVHELEAVHSRGSRRRSRSLSRRSARLKICARRSMKRTRLGRPVRASWRASWMSCSSARLRSVMSVCEPDMRVARPSAVAHRQAPGEHPPVARRPRGAPGAPAGSARCGPPRGRAICASRWGRSSGWTRSSHREGWPGDLLPPRSRAWSATSGSSRRCPSRRSQSQRPSFEPRAARA